MVRKTHSAGSKKLSEASERGIASFAHFSGILGIIPPAIIYLIAKGRGTGFAEQEAREAMDFTLVPSLVVLLCTVLSLIPAVTNFALCLAVLAWIFMTVGCVRGGSRASNGYAYTYRFTPRLLERSVFSNY